MSESFVIRLSTSGDLNALGKDFSKLKDRITGLGKAFVALDNKIDGLSSSMKKLGKMSAELKSLQKTAVGVEALSKQMKGLGETGKNINSLANGVKKLGKGIKDLNKASKKPKSKSTPSTSDQFMEGVGNEIPLLGSLNGLKANPYVAAGEILAQVGQEAYKVLKKSISAAMDFNHEMLTLKNLNLGKSSKELEGLNDQILGLSITKGLDPTELVAGFTQVQKITGKYGDEVGRIVEKVSLFSDAVGADKGGMMESIALGMNSFHLGSGDMESYLTSQAKAAQLGAISFDELATAQTEYMDAAAKSGAGYDSANKLFAAFQQNTHDVQQSAALTKAAFEGLADDKLQASLSGMGIRFTDVNGKMLESSKVVEQLAQKFNGMGDKEFSQFLTKAGGSAEMNEVFGNVRNNGSQLTSSFRNFDASSVSAGGILENAEADPSTKLEKVKNQLDGIMVSFGQMFLPVISEVLTLISDKLAGTVGIFTSLNTEGGTFANFLKMTANLLRVTMSISGFFTDIFTKSLGRALEFFSTSELFGDLFELLSGVFSGIADAMGVVTDIMAFGIERVLVPFRVLEGLYRILKEKFGPDIEKFISGIRDFFDSAVGFIRSIIDSVSQKISQLVDKLGPLGRWLGLKGSPEGAAPSVFQTAKGFLGEESYMRLANDPNARKGVMSAFQFKDNEDMYTRLRGNRDLADDVKTFTDNIDLLAKLNNPDALKAMSKFKVNNQRDAVNVLQGKQGAEFKEALQKYGVAEDIEKTTNAITDGGKSVRNVNVTIQKLVETINNNVSGVAEGIRKSEDIVLEGLVRIVNDAELALANSNTY